MVIVQAETHLLFSHTGHEKFNLPTKKLFYSFYDRDAYKCKSLNIFTFVFGHMIGNNFDLNGKA